MKQKKNIPGPLLMVLSIAGIALFMFYWLMDSYQREEKALKVKTRAAFNDAIQQLQVAKLKLNNTDSDSVFPAPGLHIKKIVKDISAAESMMVSVPAKKGMISTINVISGKLKDSMKKLPGRVMISINETTISKDTLKFISRSSPKNDDQIVRFLYNIDSLQDSLSIREIDSALKKQLVKEKTKVPFSIHLLNGAAALDDHGDNGITIGFAKPVTYQLQLGNTVPYLLKRITVPIIFSLLLLGITILAFVLLYKNLVKQRRLGEIKNEFISNISHELKTPVATVGVAIEALKNFNAMQDTERTKEYLDISTNELQRLSLLIDKVLKLSMFEKKEMELRYEVIDLKEIVDEVLLSLKLQFEKHHAAVSFEASGDLHIKGDRLHLQSVVFNLLDNALKYGKDNPVINIKVVEKNNELVFTITDNGIGIPAEYREKVFEKFFRVPHGNTHDAKGYGLGLSYAAQVIQKHRGTIKVESHTGNETTFIIHLPKQLL